jgi:TonB family protein
MSTNTADPPVSHLTPTRKPGETQRLQTLCIEVPVTVQGSRNTHPSAPFLEETRTVIVFPQGAVLRLSEIVVQGQIVIVQNMRVKQEVACRVISSKPGATAKGYVELEFTQPAPGFWGISFPGEAIAPRPVVPEATTEIVTAPVVSAPMSASPVAQVPAAPMASAEIAMPLSPMNSPAKPTPETTLELNAAIAASFGNLREAVMKPEATERAKPGPVERKEPVARPAVETRPAPVSEIRPSSIYETNHEIKAPPVVVAPPAQKAGMPPMSRNVAPPASAPMNSTTRPMLETPAASPAMPPSTARSESRQQNISRDPAPVSLADSMVEGADEMIVQPRKRAQSGAQADTLTDWRSAPKPSEAPSPSLAADSRRASGLASQGLTVMSDLGAAPDFGNQLLSAKAAERSRSGRNKMILAAAAAIVIAAGAGSYFWYAKTHTASATASISGSQPGNVPGNVAGAGVASAAPNSVTPNSVASNPQSTANGGGTPAPSSRQANNSGSGNSAANNPALKNSGAPNADKHTADSKPNSAPPVASNTRQPNVLPMNIAAPAAPTRNATQNTVAAPDLASAAPPTNTNANAPMMGTIISRSMPAAPPPAASGSSAGTSVVKEAKLISSVQPIYPKMAALRGDSGVVTVEATVNEQGKVVAARAVDGPTSLRTAAAEAVSAWKYQPATLNGKPIVVHVTVKLMFKKN